MRRIRVLFGWIVVGLTTAAVAQPYPITPLVLEGDAISGVGNVTSINNLAVNDLGDWIVEADTDAVTDADSVLLLNGALLLREGDLLPAPPGARISSFDAVNLNGNGDSGWNLFLMGPPSGQDSGVYFNTTLVIQEGDVSTASGFTPPTPYVGFFEARLNQANEMMVVASVDDPSVAGTVDRALVRLELDGAGTLLSETVVAKEGDVPPQQAEAIVEMGTGPHESAFNDSGQSLYFVDLAGSTATDGVIYLDGTVVAQEGSPSPVAGRNYELLSSRGRDLNNHGATCFKANLDGSTIDDEILVHGGTVFARERDLLPGTFFPFETFGTGSGPLRCDDNGNLLWFGDWADPDTDVDTGLFLDRVMLVQEGVTMIGGQIVDTLSSGADAFALSDNGRWVIFEATLLDGTNGAFLIEITPPPPVPDGDVVPGDQLLAGKNGASIDVTWDAASCTADQYHLLYGDLNDVAALDYSGASCNLGTTGAASFTPPAGSVFWIVAGVDASNVEGSHGFDGEGAPRNAAAGGLCGVTAQIKGAACD